MREYSFEQVLYLGKGEAPSALQKWCEEGEIGLLQFHDPIKAIKEEEAQPTLIFTQVLFSNIKGNSLVRALRDRWPGALVVALDKVGVPSFVSEVIRSGVSDYLMEPVGEEELFRTMEKCEVHLRELRDKEALLRKAERSELDYQERSMILETLLDLLSHDTRNMFINIRSLLRQFDEGPLRSMTEDAVEELYNTTMEAVGYLHSGKRIHNLVDLVSQLRLTEDRIPLSSHNRVDFQHDSQYLLFAESSPLLKNAITNLVENALKYSPEDGLVQVSVTRQEEGVEIAVADDGIGISDEDKAHIFDRYFRTKDTGEVQGSGRGLWITRNIVRSEGGTIGVEDSSGGGTVFRVELPAFRVDSLEKGYENLMEWYELPRDELESKARNVMTLLELQGYRKYADFDSLVIANLLHSLRKDKREQHRRHFRAKLHALKKKNPDGNRVLVVDDSLYVHYYLGTYLTKLGYRIVDFAQNGEEAVSFFKAFEPDFITLDITMPVKSGLEAARELHGQYPNIQIIFLTGLGDHGPLREDIGRFLPEDQYRILTKPFKGKQLVEVIGELDVPQPAAEPPEGTDSPEDPEYPDGTAIS